MARPDDPSREEAGFRWQVGVWDGISDLYVREIDNRFQPVIERLINRAALRPGERVLDLGAGTGAVALRAAPLVAPHGSVLAVDPSPAMLARAEQRSRALAQGQIRFVEGRGEAIPAETASLDVALASLSLMYAIDRAAVARELGRVLRPGGRLVAAVWAGPEQCDIVRFQAAAGRFAPMPPVQGVGPGALADPMPFLAQLAAAGIAATVESELLSFTFPDFATAWEVLAGVTTASLARERRAEAQAAVQAEMWAEPNQPRQFQNRTRFIAGRR
ncbi:MAG TPA: methyltransferase domain-containing protein [Dehalococcoidia bacterium]|nr:methyltransferase domain-containing protein [Dehalococcoidia bacterium]